MNFWAAFTILISSFSTHSAHAQNDLAFSATYLTKKSLNGTFEKIGTTPLKILGRGVHDRKTGASLTLACVGITKGTIEPECNELRWAMFVESESYFVGKKFTMSSEDHRALKNYLKSLSKGAKKQSRSATFSLLSGLGIMGSITLIATSAAVPSGVALALVAGWIVLAPNLDKISGGVNSFNGHPAYQSENADSWNWSIHSKAVNHAYFKAIFWDIARLKPAVTGGFPYFEQAHLNYSQWDNEENDSSQLITKLKLY